MLRMNNATNTPVPVPEASSRGVLVGAGLHLDLGKKHANCTFAVYRSKFASDSEQTDLRSLDSIENLGQSE